MGVPVYFLFFFKVLLEWEVLEVLWQGNLPHTLEITLWSGLFASTLKTCPSTWRQPGRIYVQTQKGNNSRSAGTGEQIPADFQRLPEGETFCCLRECTRQHHVGKKRPTGLKIDSSSITDQTSISAAGKSRRLAMGHTEPPHRLAILRQASQRKTTQSSLH